MPWGETTNDTWTCTYGKKLRKFIFPHKLLSNEVHIVNTYIIFLYSMNNNALCNFNYCTYNLYGWFTFIGPELPTNSQHYIYLLFLYEFIRNLSHLSITYLLQYVEWKQTILNQPCLTKNRKGE